MELVRRGGRSNIGLVLQPRDLEIFRWILEMGFISVDLAKEVFGAESGGKTGDGIRKRLKSLVENSYLNETIGFDGTSKKYYTATKKSADAAYQSGVTEIYLPASKKINPSMFAHNLKVMLSRIDLERSGRASGWISERVIKTKISSGTTDIKKSMMPDGIFISSIGLPCAFELELSNKTFKRYQEKVEKHLEIMQREASSYKLCLYITSTDFAYSSLKEIAKPYGNIFRIQKFEELTNVQ